MLEALISEFEAIEDPRCDWKVEHRLVDILVIAVCAVVGAAESFEDIALHGRCKQDRLQGFLELRGGIPSHGHLPPGAGADRRGALRALLPRLGALGLPRRCRGAPADRDRRQDGPALVRPPERPLALAPGQCVRHRARAGAGAARHGREEGRTLGAARLARRPGSTRLPGQPGRARLSTRSRRADHGAWWRLPACAQGQPEEGPRGGARLVRGPGL
jgi:hypothetical protein